MRLAGTCEDAKSWLLEIESGNKRANVLLFRFLVLMEVNTQSSSWSNMV